MKSSPNEAITVPPSGEVLQWALQNPEAARRAIIRLNQLVNVGVYLAAPGGNNRWPITPIEADNRTVLTLPLMFAAPIANPSGGGTIDTQCRTAVTSILTGLRLNGQLPT